MRALGKTQAAAVLLSVCQQAFHCGNMQALQQRYTAGGVVWLAIA